MNMIAFFLICVVLYYALKTYMYLHRLWWKRNHKDKISVAFFHPYCSAGGGGERVLWWAVRSLQDAYDNVHCVIYTGDVNYTPAEILEKAKKSFDIELPKPVEFVFLRSRYLVEAKHYPYFTLICQSLASIVLGLEAALKYVPDIYIDSMGYAWTYPIFKFLCSCRIAAYVHYPTISTDMLCSVSENRITVNNREFISKSPFLSNLKLLYYRVFAWLYSCMGRRAEVVMTNSTWTRNHIVELWEKPDVTFRVYPPCDTRNFEKLPLKSAALNPEGCERDRTRIVSIAQFRPEKNHELQLKALRSFFERLPSAKDKVVLVLIGSCRNEEDFERVEKLKSCAAELGVEGNVEFKIDLNFEEMVQEMRDADVALHSMWNEHFGIGVVECMSAGLITIAHNSGGPKLDIIENGKTGFLASDVNDYASALVTVWNMKTEELLEMRELARKSMNRFSVDNFEQTFLTSVSFIIQ